ncbi:MAG: hypothetical protein ACKVU2_02910 [Saprospiraceae bacterium]
MRLAWLIDPLNRKAWVYRTGTPVEEVPDFGATLSGEEVMPGFTLALSELLER